MIASQWTPNAWYQLGYSEGKKRATWMHEFSSYLVGIYREALPGSPDAELGIRLSRSNKERMAGLPDPGKYPETQGLADLVDAEWRGWRDGACLSDLQWQAFCDKLFLYHREILGKSAGSTLARCTYVYFPESDRGPLLGNNLDSYKDEPFDEPIWPSLNDHLLWGTVSSGVFLDEVSPEIFPVPVARLLGHHCGNTLEGEEMLRRYNHFWGPCNALLVDDQHSVAMIEKSACRMSVRHSTNGYGYITAMTAEEPEFRKFLDDRRSASLVARELDESCPDVRYWKETDNRRQLLGRLVSDAQTHPSFESMRQILQYRVGSDRVCYNGDDLGGIESEYTVKTTIWELRDRQAVWWARSGQIPSFLATPRHKRFS